MLLRYTHGRFVYKFHKNRMGNDIIVTSFKSSPNNCPHFKFYCTYKHRTCNQDTTIQRPSNDENESDLDGR